MLHDRQAHIEQMQRFSQLSAIAPLAREPRWSISTSQKMPIDMFELACHQRVAGCRLDVPHSAMTLDRVIKIVPDAANFAYYLDSARDNVCILDVEPECSDELKQMFSKMPRLYGEVSMSGEGMHLLIPVPTEILEKYPIAAQKSVIKDKAAGYEILFEHWVTFTGEALPEPPDDADDSTFLEMFEKLAENQREIAMHEFDISEERPDDIAHLDDIVREVGRPASLSRYITPEKYDNDISRYEFAVAAHLLKRIRNMQRMYTDVCKEDVSWTDEETTWILYECLLRTLEYREKHDTLRAGLPWLLHQAMQSVGKESDRKASENADH